MRDAIREAITAEWVRRARGRTVVPISEHVDGFTDVVVRVVEEILREKLREAEKQREVLMEIRAECDRRDRERWDTVLIERLDMIMEE